MLVGWRAACGATLGACAVGVVSQYAFATPLVRKSPVIDGYLRATCVGAHRDLRVTPPSRTWDQTLQTQGARVRTAEIEVDAAVLPPECAEVQSPAQTTAINPGGGARAIQRPDVDLAPRPPVPLLVLTWDSGETPSRYTLEIDKDGTGRFLGQANRCLTGEMTMDVPSATLEEARRIVLQSQVFDHPTRRCSSSLTDSPVFGIYFSEPPPGRKVSGELCREQRPVVKLARQLEKLLDLRGWIGKVEKCPS